MFDNQQSINDLRAVLAIIVSCCSAYFCIDMLLNGFSWTLLVSAIAGYTAVHLLWPPKCNYDSAWYDALEWIFDLPFQLMAKLLRSVGRLFRSDIDLDI